MLYFKNIKKLSTEDSFILSFYQVNPSATDCVTLRRSSDDAEQTFGFSAGFVDNSAIATWAGADTLYLVTWHNQGTGDAVFETTSAVNQVLFINNDPTYGTYLDGGGITRIVQSGTFIFDNVDNSRFFVMQRTGSASEHIIDDGGYILNVQQVNILRMGNERISNYTNCNTILATNTTYLITDYRVGTSENFYVNATFDKSRTTTLNNPGTLTLMNRSSATDRPFGGRLYEVQGYNNAVDRTVIEAEINTRHSIY